MGKEAWERVRELYGRYRLIIRYLFFGVCTTAVNTVCYGLLYEGLGIGNVASTAAAWLTAVVFAFVTNRRFVFESARQGRRERLMEFASFFGCRLMTGVLDVAIMVAAVDVMGWNSLLWKLISNVIVTVLNYVASKWFIFQSPRQ